MIDAPQSSRLSIWNDGVPVSAGLNLFGGIGFNYKNIGSPECRYASGRSLTNDYSEAHSNYGFVNIAFVVRLPESGSKKSVEAQ